jgi:VWFA-related protein
MRLNKLLLLGLISIALFLGFPEERKAENKRGAYQTFRVEVDMVSLPVVVTDKNGRRITNLEKEDFQIFENGIQHEIAGFAATDEPVNVALALDTSGSTKLQLANIQNAAIDFVNELHPDDEVAILSFANDVTLQQDFSIDRNKNEYGVKKSRSGGCTVEYEAVWLALEDVLKPIKQRKALVLFTDGVDTCSAKASLKDTIELARETNATIYCVYYDTERDQPPRRGGFTAGGGSLPQITINPSTTYPPNTYPPNQYPPDTFPRNTYPPSTYPPNPFPGGVGSNRSDYEKGYSYLTQLAQNSGGLVFNGMSDLRHAFQEVAKELASQYSIGYYSTNQKHDGKFRRVEIRIKMPGLAVRTKEGYYSKKDK